MDWLRRLGGGPATEPEQAGDEAPAWVERGTPGVSEFFRGVTPDRPHAVLDLGAATDSSLQVYSQFARWIRFAELLERAAVKDGWEGALSHLPENPDHPYDLVLAWDILDRVRPEERPLVMERLAQVTASDARLHLVVDSSEGSASPPLRFSLLDVDRMRYEPVGPPRATWPPILPAEVERLLPPFRVVRAFTSKVGLREYVAVRGK
jgi:hypothetical protein